MKAILMSGIAGAGKSTWARRYASTHPNTVVISSDDIRFELFRSHTLPRDQEKVVQKTIRERIKEAAENRLNIVLDIAVVVNKNRRKWFNRLRQYYPEVDLVFFDIPLDVCMRNNDSRERHVPHHIIKHMDAIKQQPDDELAGMFSSITIIRDYDDMEE